MVHIDDTPSPDSTDSESTTRELERSIERALTPTYVESGAGGAEANPPAARDEPADLSGGLRMTIDRYLVLRRIGRGGMGVVYSAYDEELDRKVAIKLLRRTLKGTEHVARMRREAQAMAQLSHPNVVQIYNTGVYEGELFVAMEFIAGDNLREWSDKHRAGWRELVRIFVQAGRGLAAAHRIGLVHRDFKPDNVMVGEDGRVLVMDFGLARLVTQGEGEGEPRSGTISGGHESLSSALTRAGSIIGTPAYMAPEQHQSEEVGPAADQFAFCVSLWEALYGQRPFGGRTISALSAQMSAGELREPPPGKSVPKWLRRTLHRGLSALPGERFASMDRLLIALERGQARTRVKQSLAGLGALALFGVGALVYQGYDRSERIAGCETAAASVQTIWDEDARRQLREGLLATEVSYAGATADNVILWLDRWAERWSATRLDTCLAATVDRSLSAELGARADECLEERRINLSALVDGLVRADETIVQGAVSAAANLRDATSCGDPRYLQRMPALRPEDREAARSIRLQLARARTLDYAGSSEAGVAEARLALDNAQRLGYRSLVAEVRLRLGTLLRQEGDYNQAEEQLASAYLDAAEGLAPELAIRAATDLIFVVGANQERHDAAVVWAKAAQAAERSLEAVDGSQRAARHSNLAVVYAKMGRHDEAKGLNEEVLRIREVAFGAGHPAVATTLNSLASYYRAKGDPAQAMVLHLRALAIREKTLGDEHPAVAVSLHNIGLVHHGEGEYREALRYFERALAIRERAFGPEHPDVGISLTSLADTHFLLGEHLQALALNLRSLAILEATVGADHPQVAASLNSLASLYKARGDYEQAKSMYSRAVTILEDRLGPENTHVGSLLYNLGLTHLAAGEAEVARPLLVRALAISEKTFGPEHERVALFLNGLADDQLESGAAREAKASYERALAIYEGKPAPIDVDAASSLIGLSKIAVIDGRSEEGVELGQRATAILVDREAAAEKLALSRFVTARALSARGERSQARALAEEALAGYREGDDERRRAEVEEWLADLRRR